MALQNQVLCINESTAVCMPGFVCSHARSIVHVLRAILASNGFGGDTIWLKKTPAVMPGCESKPESCLVLHVQTEPMPALPQHTACYHLSDTCHMPCHNVDLGATSPSCHSRRWTANMNVLAAERDSYHAAPATWIRFHFLKLLL